MFLKTKKSNLTNSVNHIKNRGDGKKMSNLDKINMEALKAGKHLWTKKAT